MSGCMWLNILFGDLLFPQISILPHVPCEWRASFYFHFEGPVTTLVSSGALLTLELIQFVFLITSNHFSSRGQSIAKQFFFFLNPIDFTNFYTHKFFNNFSHPNLTAITVCGCTGCNRQELAPAVFQTHVRSVSISDLYPFEALITAETDLKKLLVISLQVRTHIYHCYKKRETSHHLF